MTVSRTGKRGKPKMRPAGRNSRVKYNGRMKMTTRTRAALPAHEGMIYVARHIEEGGRDVRPTNVNDNISALALQHGRYETVDSIYRPSIIETEIAPRVLNRAVTVIDGWIDDDVFHHPQVRVIEYCRELWRDIRYPRHPYFDSYDPEERNDSFEAERAKNLLRRCRRLVGDYRWGIFENVVRWNEPTGVPGSRISSPTEASIGAAQDIVRSVAQQVRAIL